MNSDLLNRFDAEVLGAPTSRRDALRRAGRLGGAATLAMTPFFAMAKRAVAANPAYRAGGDVAILNYALTLEYLERAFYRKALNTGRIDGADRPLFELIERDESAHVVVLSGAISDAGADPVEFDDDDFVFDVDGTDYLSSYDLIKTLAQGFEDTGVRAYKGQAAAIMDPDTLTVALQIHSVEARHAAAIRRLRGNQGWIPNSQPGAPAAIAATYGPGDPESMFPAEGNTVQGGLDLTSALMGYTAEDISEAFDEPLDMETVAGEDGIATPFIQPDGDGEED